MSSEIAHRDNGFRVLVMKFGGTSVGSPEAIMQMVRIIKEQRQEGRQLVVVVSAMSGVTNLLITCAKDAAAGNQEKFTNDISLIKKRHVDIVNNLPYSKQSRKKVHAVIQDYLIRLRNYCVSIYTMEEVTPRGLDAITSLGERMNAHLINELLFEEEIPNQPIDADHLTVTAANLQNTSTHCSSKPKKLKV